MEDGGHLLSDGHLYAMALGEAESSGGGADAFGNFAVEASEDFRKLAAFAELDAYGAVAREAARAGEDEIADAGEAGHGFDTAT
jgi:hypothetical protein